MLKLPIVKIGDGCKPDMRMWPHIYAAAGQKLGWPHLIEEDERTDHLSGGRRKCTSDFETTKIARSWNDLHFD